MFFWCFMTFFVLFIPVIMIIAGKVFIKNAPEKINHVYGYRTTMSMKSKETWAFAHHYFGKLWFVFGLVILPLSVIPMLFVIGKDNDAIGITGTIIIFVQFVPMLGAIIPTEIVLRKKFDKDGNKKDCKNQ